MPSNKLKADIGVITVIPSELEWTRQALAIPLHSRQKVPSGRIYYVGDVPAIFNPHSYRVTLTCIGEAGASDCAATTSALIHECRPRLVLLVGIAAGMRKGTKIGTVIISERVWDYERAAVISGRRRRMRQVPRPNAPLLSFGIQQDLTHYFSVLGLNDRVDQRFKAMGEAPPTPVIKKDVIATTPDISLATVASGNKLLRHPRFLHTLQVLGHGRIKVGEMEASGLATACRQESTDWLVIRGVSDFGDQSKSDHYQRFAAQMAAAVARDFIERGLQLSVTPRPKIRRVAAVSALPTVSEIQKVVDSLPVSTRPAPSGPVVAKMLELSGPFNDRAYRLLRGQHTPELRPVSVASRWSARGALYFASTAEAAYQELYFTGEPHVGGFPMILIAEFAMRLSYVLNLRDASVLQALNIDAEALRSDDYAFPRSVADAARTAGCEGLSFSGMRTMQPMLCIFDRLSPSSEITLISKTPYRGKIRA